MTIRTLMTVFLVALNTAFSSAALDYLGDSDLVAWWTFEAGDGETARDRTDNNNNGVLKNGAGWTRDAGIGTALKLDGVDDYVDCGDAEILDISEHITLEAWIYPYTGPPGETWIIGKTHSSYALAFNANSTAWFYVSGGGNNPRVPVPLGEWSHVVGTYNGSKMRVYLNGELDAMYSLSEPIKSSGQSVWIGRTRDAYFNGMIDEVRIYRRPLSAREVRAHYADGRSRLPKPAPVDRSELKGLARQVFDLGDKPATLKIESVESVATDLQVPANICLQFEMGGRVAVADGAALTITGPVQAPLAHIFEGPGQVVFDSRFVKEVYPQWWGAKADRKTDDTAAIQAAIDANHQGGRVFLPAGTYAVSKTITLRNKTRLIGARAMLRGIVKTMLQAPNPAVRTSGWRIRGLTLNGMDRQSSEVGMDYTKQSYSLVEDVQIRGFAKGILLDGGNEASMYNTFRKVSVAACDTAIEVNNSSIGFGFYDCIIGNIGTAFLINTTNQFVISNTTIEGFNTGVDMRRGDTMHLNYLYFAGGKTGIKIAKGVSECTILNPRFSQVHKQIVDEADDTLILDKEYMDHGTDR